MSFWSVHHLNLDDEVNNAIWSRSPALHDEQGRRRSDEPEPVLQARLGLAGVGCFLRRGG